MLVVKGCLLKFLLHTKADLECLVFFLSVCWQSMVNFLLDPTGDLPWEEDPTAVNVVHLSTEEVSHTLLSITCCLQDSVCVSCETFSPISV